ncbi:hypothetical protein HY632_05415 [Candidatus Uhrbacteria bacterium]|nr:hypothetical protein [Candidatus Uhrbacteria bacterium]
MDIRVRRVAIVSVLGLAACTPQVEVKVEPDSVNVAPSQDSVNVQPSPPAAVNTVINLPAPPVPTRFDLTVLVETTDYALIPRRVLLDGETLAADGASLDPAVAHVLVAQPVDRYVLLDTATVTIPANRYQAGDRRTVRFLYGRDERERCAVVQDQFGNRVPATVTLVRTGDLLGVGRGCALVQPDDAFSIGTVDGYVFTSDPLVPVASFMERVMYVLLVRPNAFQFCEVSTNESDLAVDATLAVDGINVPDRCTALDVRFPHRASLVHTPSDLQQPPPYGIIAGAVAAGGTKTVRRALLPTAATTKMLAVEVLPPEPHYEVLRNGQSLGWVLSWSEPVLDVMRRDEMDPLPLTVTGTIPTAVVVVRDVSWTRDVVLLLHADRLALLCGRAFTPWGSDINTGFTISSTTFAHRYGRPTCAAVDPQQRQVARFERPTDLPQLTLVPPEEEVFVPGDGRLVAGRVTWVDGEFQEEREPPKPPPPSAPRVITAVVRVSGPMMGGSVRHALTVPMSIREWNATQLTEKDEVDVRVTEGRTATVTFNPVAGLSASAPTPIVIDPRNPGASGGVLDGMDRDGNMRWVWDVRYTSPDRIWLACVESVDHNGVAIERTSGAAFDAWYTNVNRAGLPCRYFSMLQDHFVTPWWFSGFVQPRQISAPAGLYTANTLRIFQVRHIPNSIALDIAIRTNGARGEIFVDGASVGANATIGGWTYVVIDQTRAHRVSFGAVPGFAALADELIGANPLRSIQLEVFYTPN